MWTKSPTVLVPLVPVLFGITAGMGGTVAVQDEELARFAYLDSVPALGGRYDEGRAPQALPFYIDERLLEAAADTLCRPCWEGFPSGETELGHWHECGSGSSAIYQGPYPAEDCEETDDQKCEQAHGEICEGEGEGEGEYLAEVYGVTNLMELLDLIAQANAATLADVIKASGAVHMEGTAILVLNCSGTRVLGERYLLALEAEATADMVHAGAFGSPNPDTPEPWR